MAKWTSFRNDLPLTDIEDFLRQSLFAVNGKSVFPPYNVINSTDGNKTMLQFAVAGYAPSDIEIELVDGKLRVSSKKIQETQEGWEIAHKGISAKAFDIQFEVSRSFDVSSATFSRGMLEILLERVEGSKKKIEIDVK